MKIITVFVYPPIPTRSFDWVAYLDGEEEQPSAMAYGETKQEALDGLGFMIRERIANQIHNSHDAGLIPYEDYANAITGIESLDCA